MSTNQAIEGQDPPAPVPNDYKNSQAFQNVININDESINPNTGTLNFAAPLFTLKGVTSSTDLSVRVCYSQGTPGTFGLPESWGLDLPFIVGTDSQSLTLDARVYLIDFGWDSAGYKSGLRYVNTQGMLLTKADPQPLPSGLSGQYTYSLRNSNGAMDYFDDQGKLLEHDDLYNNVVHYTYVPDSTSKVDYITDSWGQQIKFTYTDTSMTVTLPDGAVTTVAWDGDGLRTITDPVNDATSFELTPFGPDNKKLLSKIQYPSGAVSTFTYVGLDFQDTNGKTGQLPAVSDRFSYDGETVLKHTTYNYGAKTFTGAAIGVQMGPGGDALMDGTSPEVLGYAYDVVRTDMDGEQPIAQTRSSYNHLHLCTSETKLTSVEGQLRDTYMTANTYDGSNSPSATNFDKPLTVENFHNTTPAADVAYEPMTRTESTYNEFGNVVTVSESLYVKAATSYIAQTAVTNQYQNTNFGTQILTNSTDQDLVAQHAYITANTLTADTRDIAATSLSSAIGENAPTLPWKTRSFVYDGKGRITSETLAWSGDAPVPQGTPSTVTYTSQFSDLNNGILTHVSLDATGNATTTQTDLRRNTGPTISKQLPMGETETWEHDALGRVVKHTDALRNETTKKYSVGGAGNWEETTAPAGYITRTTYDVLDREISKQDNGDPTQPSQGLNRILQEKTYDALSRVLTSTDTLGLVTSNTFDALNRPLTSTDALKNILTYAYDDGNLTVTQSINGDLRSVETLNGRSQLSSVIKYADSGDANQRFSLREDTVYDGEGRIITKTVSQVSKDGGNSAALRSESVSYGPESMVLTRTATGLGMLPNVESPDTVTRTYSYDLFGNVFTYTKSTYYAGMNQDFVHNGPQTIYDANNRLVSVLDQENGTEAWSYNANGWLDYSIKRDGSRTTYTYDPVGRNISTTYGADTQPQIVNTAYDLNGKITSVIQDKDTVAYQYSLDGTLVQTTFSDGKTQSYSLDKYSRTVSSTDAFSVQTTHTFDVLGNLTTTTCQDDRMSYMYGTVNHTAGKTIGSALSGPNKNYRVDYAYDGFDRLQRHSTTDSSGVLLDTTYQNDIIGRLEGYTSTSESRPEVAEARQFVYDGFNQVVSDSRTALGTTSVTLYAYDGNSNVVQQETAGQVQTMTYNKIDQRVDAGFTYDQNGHLTHDPNGLSYGFDVKDQLTSVNSNSGQQQFTYHANDYLATCAGPLGQSSMYYDGEKINAMQVSQDQAVSNTSLFREIKSIVASYTAGQAEAYFFDRQGSTALLEMTQPGATTATLNYSTYGDAKVSSPLPAQDSFGFRQEYFDQGSGLVYLRSRYYNPNIASFISMDNYRGENRYAYCKGDPINLIDSTGHMPSWLKKTLTIGAGVLLGAGVTWLTAGLLAPEVAGLEGALISGAIGGAAGNITGGFLTAKYVDHKSYSIEQGLIDGLTGAVGGAVSAGVGEALGSSLNSMIPGRSLKYVGKALTKLNPPKMILGGAASTATQQIVKPIFTAEVHAAWSIGSSIKHGSRAGVSQMIAAGHASVLSPQAMVTMYSTQEDTATQIVSQQSVADSVYKAPQLSSNSTGSSGAGPKGANASFDPGFSTAHDWTPSSMSDIVKKANKSFGKQWNDWDAGVVGHS